MIQHLSSIEIEPPDRKVKWRRSYTGCFMELALYRLVIEGCGVDWFTDTMVIYCDVCH